MSGVERDCAVCGGVYDEYLGFTMHENRCAALPTPAQGLDAATIERIIRNEVGDICYDDIRWLSNRQIVERCLRALNTASTTTRGEDARLREALEAVMKRQGFAEPTLPDGSAPSDDVFVTVLCTLGDLRRARAALQADAPHTSQEKGE